ncbi:MAG: type IV secretory system conjugative DNA transfer family protein [Clostridiaceae bacterium]
MRSDRWAYPLEIKEVLTLEEACGNAGGQVLYRENNQNWVYGGEGHTIILGVSGSGKSRRGTLPMVRSLIWAEESFSVLDPKGEIYDETVEYARRQGFEVHVVNLRHIRESERWNPLTLPYELGRSDSPENKQISAEMIDELAHSIYKKNDSSDPFWTDSARSLFIGAVYALMEYAKPEQVTMAGVYQLIVNGEKRCGPVSLLKAFVDEMPENSVTSMLLQSYLNTASDTRGGIRSTFLEGISTFTRSEGVLEFLVADDLKIGALDGARKTGVYIILPDENPIFDRLAGVLMSQLMSHYIRLAQNTLGGRLPIRMNVCLEELGNVGGALANLPHLMSAGRSRNIRCQLVLQSLSQLTDIYGASSATTILSNADVIVAYRTNHWDTLTELSRKCGEREVDYGAHTSREALITQSQIGSMQTGQALVMVSGRLKFITCLPDYSDMYPRVEYREPVRNNRQYTPPPEAICVAAMIQELKAKKESLEDAKDEEKSEDEPGERVSFFDLMLAELNCNNDDPKAPKSAIQERIDARMAELREERLEKSGKKANKRKGGYDVMILHDGGNRSAVINALIATRSATRAQALIHASDLPIEIHLKSKRTADKLKKSISLAGGTAIVYPAE